MGVTLSNNGNTTIAEDITAGELEIDVAATASFPNIDSASDYFWATLVAQDGTREVIKVNSLSGSTYTVLRGQDGTDAAAFSNGDRFQLRFPKVIIEDFRDDIDRNTTDLAGTTNSASVPAPAGTRMWFYQAAAPAEWTIYTTVADCLVAVKGGSQDYASNIGDGVEAGSWTPTAHAHTLSAHTHTYAHTHGQAAHTHTGPSHTHTGPSHRHSLATHRHTIAHTHTYSGTTAQWGGSAKESGSGSNDASDQLHTHTYSGTTSGSSASNSGYSGTLYTGYDGTGATGSAGTGATGSTDAGSTNSQSTSTTAVPSTPNTSSVSPDSTDRPLAAVGILATKD